MTLSAQALQLPETPGCYLMKNDQGEIIYIGKAVNLKRRVSSYFRKQKEEKLKRLVQQISSFDIIYLDTEEEALLLEARLIFELQPYFNRALKKARSYYYFHITNHEPNPRLFLKEEIDSQKGIWFGPYSSKHLNAQLFSYLENYYPLSKCSKNRGAPCLYVSLGTCLGGCYQVVDPKLYEEQIKKITTFMNAPVEHQLNDVKAKQDKLIQDLLFERAQEIQELLESLTQVSQRKKLPQSFKSGDYWYLKQTGQGSLVYWCHIRNHLNISEEWWLLSASASMDEVKNSITAFYHKNKKTAQTQLFLTEKIFNNAVQETLIKEPSVLEWLEETASLRLKIEQIICDFVKK